VRDVQPFSAIAPSGEPPLAGLDHAGARPRAQPRDRPCGAAWFYDWGGGLIWIAAPSVDGCGGRPSGAVQSIGRARDAGSGRRRRCARRSTCSSPSPIRSRRARRVKESFDPKGVLNPGRMWAGVVMQTNFSLVQLADPDIAEADKIRGLRALRFLPGDLSDLRAARRRLDCRAGAST